MNINTIKTLKKINIFFNIALLLTSVFPVLIIALYNTAKFYKPLLSPLVVCIIVELICIVIVYKLYLKIRRTIIDLKIKDNDNMHRINFGLCKYYLSGHTSLLIKLLICFVCFVFAFCLYSSLSSFSPEKWHENESLRPFMMNSFFSQNTRPDNDSEYNFLVECRQQIRETFSTSTHTIDVTVEISKICENETYDIYWAYNDYLGNNYWIIFIYPDSDDGICSQPVFLISGEHMIIGESNYSMERNPSSLLL